jgi:glucokinase
MRLQVSHLMLTGYRSSNDLASRPVLALDFGGTKLAAGIVVPAEGKLLGETRANTPPGGAQSSLRAMVTLASEARSQCDARRPRAVGVSFGGPVDSSGKIVVRSLHVAGWENFHLARHLEDTLGLPVYLDNDANAAALGEWRFGAGQGAQCVVYYTISTGVGGGIVFDGAIFRGAQGVAGELGHVVIDRDGPLCPCGHRGCVEALCAGPAIAARAEALLASHGPHEAPLLWKLRRHHGALSAKLVAEAARGGDVIARKVWHDVGRDLALGIADVANVLNPEAIVLGGGVAQAGELLFGPLLATLPEHVYPDAMKGLKVVPAALGEQVALFGAAALTF